MKFTICREDLLTPLQQVTGVIERRQTLPILSHVLVRLAENRIELTGTDLEVQLVTRSVVESGDDGAITIPARKLLDICRLLPEQSRIIMDCREDKVAIHCERSRFNLGTLPASNYPEFDSATPDLELTFNGQLLHKAMSKTVFAMAQQDVRYYLNGLMLEVDADILRTVSSDGHRLALYEEALENGPGQQYRVIIPRKAVMELYRLISEQEQPVTLQMSPNNIRLFVGDLSFSAKLIEGRFPDFQRLMPRDISKVITVEKNTLRAALTRVSVLSTEKYKGITVALKGGLMSLQAQNSEQEEAEEEVEVEFVGEGFTTGFNAAYLLDAINNVDSEEVRLSFTDSVNSCLIEDVVNQSFKFIVMPMRR